LTGVGWPGSWTLGTFATCLGVLRKFQPLLRKPHPGFLIAYRFFCHPSTIFGVLAIGIAILDIRLLVARLPGRRKSSFVRNDQVISCPSGVVILTESAQGRRRLKVLWARHCKSSKLNGRESNQCTKITSSCRNCSIRALCRRSSPFRSQPRLITRHARYAMISPTRKPTCLRCLAIRFSLALMLVGVVPATATPLPSLLHWLRFRVGNWRCLLWRLAGRRRAHWLRSRRHRLFQRYDSISSNGLSDLSHG